MIRRFALLLWTPILCVLIAPVALAAPDRVALVIGNGAYLNATKLPNPTNDATDIAQALRRIGFDVVEGRDLDKRGLEAKILEFGQKLDRANVALFFYAGHGLQVGGRNYLVPVDAKLERAGNLNFETIDVSLVLAQMEAEKRVNLVFLDACRDNPLARSFARSLGATRSAAVGQGLASIQSAVGTMIAYATEPDKVALDGDGRNSPFTTAVLKHIVTPGLEIRSMMTRVRADVLSATRDKQLPWDHSSLIGEVVLVPGAAQPAAPGPASDEIAWSFLKDTQDVNQLRRFVEQYPSSSRLNEAAARLLTLEQQKFAAVPPTPNPPAPPAGGFSRVSTFDPGVVYTSGDDNIIPQRKITSAESCRDLCLVTPSCLLWQFEKAKPVCHLSRSVGYITCTQCSNTTSGRISEQPRAALATISPPAAPQPHTQPLEPVRTSAIVNNRSLYNLSNDVISSLKLPSAAECRDSCVKDKTCNAWSYYQASYEASIGAAHNDRFRKVCTLRKTGSIGETGTIESPGIASGIVKLAVAPVAQPSAAPPPEPVRTSAIVNNRALADGGRDITANYTGSAAECRDKCIKNTKCNAWDYYPLSYSSRAGFSQLCRQRETGTIGKTESPGVASGIVTTGKAAAASSRK